MSAMFFRASFLAFSTVKLARVIVREQKMSSLRNTVLMQHRPSCAIGVWEFSEAILRSRDIKNYILLYNFIFIYFYSGLFYFLFGFILFFIFYFLFFYSAFILFTPTRTGEDPVPCIFFHSKTFRHFGKRQYPYIRYIRSHDEN